MMIRKEKTTCPFLYRGEVDFVDQATSDTDCDSLTIANPLFTGILVEGVYEFPFQFTLPEGRYPPSTNIMGLYLCSIPQIFGEVRRYTRNATGAIEYRLEVNLHCHKHFTVADPSSSNDGTSYHLPFLYSTSKQRCFLSILLFSLENRNNNSWIVSTNPSVVWW
jgi:hypothetical protein